MSRTCLTTVRRNIRVIYIITCSYIGWNKRYLLKRIFLSGLFYTSLLFNIFTCYTMVIVLRLGSNTHLVYIYMHDDVIIVRVQLTVGKGHSRPPRLSLYPFSKWRFNFVFILVHAVKFQYDSTYSICVVVKYYILNDITTVGNFYKPLSSIWGNILPKALVGLWTHINLRRHVGNVWYSTILTSVIWGMG